MQLQATRGAPGGATGLFVGGFRATNIVHGTRVRARVEDAVAPIVFSCRFDYLGLRVLRAERSEDHLT